MKGVDDVILSFLMCCTLARPKSSGGREWHEGVDDVILCFLEVVEGAKGMKAWRT